MSTQIRMPGKGSRRRPTAVQADTFASNWERAFGKKDQPTPDLCICYDLTVRENLPCPVHNA